VQRKDFDFCVLGAGSAGFAAATRARELGKSVAFVDGTGPLAGLCILQGCMPGKTLLHAADVARTVKNAGSVGIDVPAYTFNVAKVVHRKQCVIDEFANDRVHKLEEFPMFRGAPRFVSNQEIAVGDYLVAAKKFLIATGSVINIPDIPGLRETGFLCSDDILDAQICPKRIIIMGGGAVAAELCQYLLHAGTQTTVLQRSAHILSSEDSDIGECLRTVFERDGIRVVTGVQFQRVERFGGGKRVHAIVDGKEQSFVADEVLAALGRRANVDNFGLEAAGVEFTRNGVLMNEYLQTSNPDIYAAGDVTGIWRLLHVAVYEGKLAAQNAFGPDKQPARYDLQRARVIFSSPQVGIAGLSERRAREQGIWYDKATFPFCELGKAIVMNATDGFVKMLCDKDGRILGITYVGAEASDLLHEAIALLYFHANIRDVLAIPHIHPTLAEILTAPAEELAGRTSAEPFQRLGYAWG